MVPFDLSRLCPVLARVPGNCILQAGSAGGEHVYLVVNFDECDVRLLVHVLDFGFVGGSIFQLNFDPVLVSHHVGVCHNQSIFGHDKPRPTGHRHLPLRKREPRNQKSIRLSTKHLKLNWTQ